MSSDETVRQHGFDGGPDGIACRVCGFAEEFRAHRPSIRPIGPVAVTDLKQSAADGLAPLLDEVEALLRRYLFFPNESQPVAVTLWVAHTWAIEAAEATPYLYVTSPERECGKSRLLHEVLPLLVREQWTAVDVTEAVLFRYIHVKKPTLLLDEVDTTFGKDQKQTEGIRAVLNVGNRRSTARVPRCGKTAKGEIRIDEFEVFCPKALAGIGGRLPDTVLGRSIRIELQRKARGERVERFHSRDAEEIAAPLRQRLASWATQAVAALAKLRPGLPDALSDRAREGWEPLLAIADLAGGSWPQRARAAAVGLHRSSAREDGSNGVLVLAHIRRVFDEADQDRLPTTSILERLVASEDGPWGGWWSLRADEGTRAAAIRLAKLLRPFGIAPKDLRTADGVLKGYTRDQFAEAWERYVPPESAADRLPVREGDTATPQVSTTLPSVPKVAAA